MAEVIGALKISLGLDSIDFSKGMSNVDKRIAALNTEFKAISAGSAKFDNSLEALGKRSDVLTRTFQTHQAKVQELKRQYDESNRASGENSAETLRLASAYNRAYAAMQKTEDQLNYVNRKMADTSNELSNQKNLWQNVSRKIDETGDSLKNTGQKMSQAGQNLTASLTLPIAGFATAAGKAALDFDKSSGQIQAELGLSESKAKELNDTAKELWEDGFGDSIGSVSSKIAGVTRSLGDLGKVDLSYVTKGLDLFEQRGWADQQESLRAIKVLMEQFGMSASEAMDYLTKGFQENLNFSGEFLDTISEYSTYFSEFGFDADQMFAKLKSGAESGAFQLDKVGDAMKEFSLRAKDGSKTSEEAFKALGLNATDMTKKFNKGGDTAKKAFETVVKALKNTDDETVRNTASVGLFGTQFEDLGDKAFDAMIDAGKGLKDVEGATKKASDALRDNFGTRATKIWRDFVEDMEPVGEILLDVAEDILPKVADKIGDVTEAFEDMSPEGKNTALAIGGIAAAAGPTLIALGTLTSGLGSVSKMVSPLLPMLGGGAGFTGILSKIPGPVGLVATGLGLATAATIGIKDAMDKAKEVNLEHTDSLIDQQLALEDSVQQYDALKDKLNLSNDQLAEYLDLQDKIKIATDPGKVQEYKDAMAGLQEKSGLTVKEFEKFVGLDEDIRKNAPDTTTKVTEYGNAFIDLSSDLEPVLGKQREFINNQLLIEKDKAYENLKESADELLETQEKLGEVTEHHNSKLIEQADYRQKAKDLEEQINQARADGDTASVEHFTREQTMWTEKANNMDSEIDRLYKGFTVQQEKLGNLYNQVAEGSKIYDQLVEQELKMNGINGKSEEALSLLDQKISKLQQEKSSLDANYSKGKLTTEEYEEQNQKLGDQISNLIDSRDRVSGIKEEQNKVTNEIETQIGKGKNLNELLNKDTVKNVNVDDHGRADKLQKNVERKANKNVDVDDNGDNAKIQKASEKKAYKGIKLSLINSVASLLPPAISMPIKFIGGKLNIPGFATGTRNAPGGLSLVGEEGPELIHLPQGAKVIPNPQSEAILNNWNIPMMATGGVTITDGMALVGEEGRELLDLTGARTAPLSGGNRTNIQPIINPSPVIIDGYEITKIIFDYVDGMQSDKFSNQMALSGVKRP